MKRSGKNYGDARPSVAVAVTSEDADPPRRKRKGVVGVGLSMRRELLRQFAPQYQEASVTQKRVVLTDFVRFTGYHRKYAISLLNHHHQEQQVVERPSRCVYKMDVQEALVQVWEHSNCLCSKRLIPFLPTLVAVLERHEHVHLLAECRAQLLTISTATADRLLRPHRQRVRRGLSTTRVGTALKQNIPIRTFEQWDEQKPGFVEADLVAHCDTSAAGSYLFTLTLTDVATGWTECLPLLTKSAEAVLAALHQARSFFPFPLLGIDTDNGTEFMNEQLMAYCKQEQLTFTRGRPLIKNDQCYVEQKNGHIVRQVVGYARFVGEQACQCLDKLYRVVSLYVNYFQPSMKLCGKLKEGKKVQHIYDEAKTPLTRLLHAEILPQEQWCAFLQYFESLDSVRLMEQVKQAQQALFAYATHLVPHNTMQGTLPAWKQFRMVGKALVPCAYATVARGTSVAKGEEEVSQRDALLSWHRTDNDPFQGAWERIAEWVCADPTRSCRAMFEELRQLSPEHYQPSHLRTLQRGVQKIRARLALLNVPPHDDVHEAEGVVSVEHDKQGERAVAVHEQEAREEETQGSVLSMWCCVEEHSDAVCSPQEPEEFLALNPSMKLDALPDENESALEVHSGVAAQVKTSTCVTIAEGIEQYLEIQRWTGRRPKTLEWHKTALHLLGQYLRTEWGCLLLAELREEHLRGWMQWLRAPTAMGIHRTENTITSYARSARAWCCWLAKDGSLLRTPFTRIHLAKGEPSAMQPLQMEHWERLLLACDMPGESGPVPQWAPARNQALLWVLYDPGMRLFEVCNVRLKDVDVEQGTLVVRSERFKSRQLRLGQKASQAVRLYVEQYRLGASGRLMEGSGMPLFLSETGHALTKNGIVLLFARLRKRAGLTREEIGPTLLRDSFALRYVQAGGDVFMLRDVLGREESAIVKRSLCKSNTMLGSIASES